MQPELFPYRIILLARRLTRQVMTMIGSKTLTAILLMPFLVSAIPRDLDIYGKKMLRDMKAHRANMEYAFSMVCVKNRLQPIYRESICTEIAGVSTESNAVMTTLFCSQYRCGAEYDPSTGLCQCSLGLPPQVSCNASQLVCTH